MLEKICIWSKILKIKLLHVALCFSFVCLNHATPKCSQIDCSAQNRNAVCGNDGRIYSNLCEMEKESCWQSILINQVSCRSSFSQISSCRGYKVKRHHSSPIITNRVRVFKKIAGENFTLTCRAQGSPLPVIFWHKNGEQIEKWQQTSGNQSGLFTQANQLIFRSFKESLAGNYTCQVFNCKLASEHLKSFESRQREMAATKPFIEAVFTIKYKTLNNKACRKQLGSKAPITQEDQTIVGEIGRSIQMDCLIKGIPTPVYKWYFKSSNNDRKRYSVAEGEGIRFSTDKKHLFIDTLQMQHDGKFVCIASNCLTPPVAKKKIWVNVRHRSSENFEEGCLQQENLNEICSGNEKRVSFYAFDLKRNRCVLKTEPTCAAVKNKFNTINDCNLKCGVYCNSKPKGTCGDTIGSVKWFYNPKKSICEMFDESLCKKTNNNFKKLSECQNTCVIRKKLINLYKKNKAANVPIKCQHQKCLKPILLTNYCTQDFIIRVNDISYNEDNNIMRYNMISTLASKNSTMAAHIQQYQMSNGQYKIRVRDSCKCLKIKVITGNKDSTASYTLSGILENSELVLEENSYFEIYSESDVKQMRGFKPQTCNLFYSWSTYNLNTNVITAALSAGISINKNLNNFDSYVGDE